MSEAEGSPAREIKVASTCAELISTNTPGERAPDASTPTKEENLTRADSDLVDKSILFLCRVQLALESVPLAL